MAPEQLAGGPLTVQTDLYALGLIVREIFTGSRARSSESSDALRDGEPLPASHAGAIDPRVEAAVLNCVDREMKDRPRSALAVAAALPRSEPLAAALAAGRTPSPDMVAAARREALRPAVAALLAAMLVGGVLLVGLLNRSVLPNLAPTLSPPVLAARAHDIIRALGTASQLRTAPFGSRGRAATANRPSIASSRSTPTKGTRSERQPDCGSSIARVRPNSSPAISSGWFSIVIRRRRWRAW